MAKRNKILASTLALILTFSLLIALIPLNLAQANQNIPVFLNGNLLSFDQPPLLKEGRVLVPLRGVFEALGTKVNWDSRTKTVTAENEEVIIKLVIGQKTADVHYKDIGISWLGELDVPAQIINGRTLVPLRFVSEALGATVNWDGTAKTVTIFSDKAPSQKERKKLSSEEIVELIQPSVVLIQTQRGQGSGFFVSADGEIVTNAHMVRGSQWITVTTADGQTYSAAIIAVSNPWDLAIIKIDTYQECPYIEYFTESYNVKIGEEVIAFGNPLGLEGTVTRGIISAKREMSPSEAWEGTITVLQHDAVISYGSSGGPLVNMYGELVGVNYSGIEAKDFNFAIPAEYYSYLSENAYGYTLLDDAYCFWTESYDWDIKINEIETFVSQSLEEANTKGNPYLVVVSIENIALPQIDNLMQQVDSYYPAYSEVEEIRQLLLNYLNSLRTLYTWIAYTFEDPSAYSEAQASALFNRVGNAQSNYYNEKNRLMEMVEE